jgi:hypothetical protein
LCYFFEVPRRYGSYFVETGFPHNNLSEDKVIPICQS